jgi:hypothetical protein
LGLLDCASEGPRFKIKTRDDHCEVGIYGAPPDTPPSDELLSESDRQLQRSLGSGCRRRRGPDPSYGCHGLTLVAKLGWVGFIRSWEPDLILPIRYRHRKEAERARRAAHLVDAEIENILRGNSYALRDDLRLGASVSLGDLDVEVGDIAVYRKYYDADEAWHIRHSGIVVAVKRMREDGPVKDIEVHSKFGHLGEYIHPFRLVPATYGDLVQIWSDRNV